MKKEAKKAGLALCALAAGVVALPRLAAAGDGAMKELTDLAGGGAAVSVPKASSPKPVRIKAGAEDGQDGDDTPRDAFHRRGYEMMKVLFHDGEKPAMEDLKGWRYGLCINSVAGHMESYNGVFAFKIGKQDELQFAVFVEDVRPLDGEGRLRQNDAKDISDKLETPGHHAWTANWEERDALKLSRHISFPEGKPIDILGRLKKSGKYLVYFQDVGPSTVYQRYCYLFQDVSPR